MLARRLLLTFGLVIAMIGSASPASANPHTTLSEVHTSCSWESQVVFNDSNNESGLDDIPSNNYHIFVQPMMSCIGVLGGAYDAYLDPRTTDMEHSGIGEDCEQGGTVKDDADLHSATMSVLGAHGAQDVSGKIHLVRLGTVILADGPFWDGTLLKTGESPDHFFRGNLELTFSPGQDCIETPVRSGYVVGTVEFYPGTAIHDCSLDDKSGDPHC